MPHLTTPSPKQVILCGAILVAVVSLSGLASAKTTRTNQIQVKAKLIEIPGKFPPDDLYDYAYVLKYQVIGGTLDKKNDFRRALQAETEAHTDQRQNEKVCRWQAQAL